MPPIVIVETDARHADYDERLVALLKHAEPVGGADEKLPFPRTDKISATVRERDYHRVVITGTTDPAWHIQLTVAKAAQVEVTQQPDEEAPLSPTELATVRLRQPDASIDVIGMTVMERADLADWLEEWLQQLGMAPVSSRPRRTRDGVMGDILATGRAPAGMLAARYATLRFGSRMFVIVLRSPIASYRLVAQDFVLAMSSLTPLRVD